jgi:hypothetical protein
LPPLYTLEYITTTQGLSEADVSTYIEHYREKLSQQASQTPPQFTQDDLKLFAYVKQELTSSPSTSHDEILTKIENGALDSFAWTAPSGPTGEQPPSPSARAKQELAGFKQKFLDSVIAAPVDWMVAVLVLLLISLIIYAIIRPGILKPLEGIDYARGVITFVIAITTVVIALI